MSTLAMALAAFRDAMIERAGPEKAAAIAAAYQAVLDAGLPEQAVRVGDVAPDFALPDLSGKEHRLSAELARGPVVLLFYRGLWCPFCAKALRAMEKIRPALELEGGSMLAVSPQLQATVAEAASSLGLGLTLLHDAGGEVAGRYRLNWTLPEKLRQLFGKFGHPLAQENGDDGTMLPMLAVYVIGRDGVVVAARVDPRPTEWMEPAEALEAVRKAA